MSEFMRPSLLMYHGIVALESLEGHGRRVSEVLFGLSNPAARVEWSRRSGGVHMETGTAFHRVCERCNSDDMHLESAPRFTSSASAAAGGVYTESALLKTPGGREG